MTDSSGMGRCDCGATPGPLGECADYYHAILAEEQADPEMFRWHTVVVCAYLLQHPARGHEKHLDGQFRLLQLCLDKGLEALLRVAANQVARNRRGSRSGYDMAPLEAYAPLPRGVSPGPFRASFCRLPFRDGSLVFDGYPAYGSRIVGIAAATVESWSVLTI
ncbi:DUF5946 family protein [Microbispora hainanensis]|uniref:Uncharacterized protein n=1 Tax=Microbispora hainanensis TaxID=568844 RepID=A0A544Z536_9ACTN|nr:DUF5946 family protein [Microbispora hainanensis]TQS24153.1 hypothetical protein FLX08_00065 [Microbispora hainanensis]